MNVGRRGKYLLLELDDKKSLVLHLRMTGRLTQTALPIPESGRKHLRLMFQFDGDQALMFHDVRRFGTAFVLQDKDASSYWRRLGLEPLERSFNSKSLKELLAGRKRPIKSLLLDQSLIAGIGNIYADEALFAAGIHPLRPANEVSDEETGRLAKAIKATLRNAIRLAGSSIDTYRDAWGRAGRFQDTFRVHRRQGDPCPGCSGTVEKIKVGGRGTYFCPGCQR